MALVSQLENILAALVHSVEIGAKLKQNKPASIDVHLLCQLLINARLIDLLWALVERSPFHVTEYLLALSLPLLQQLLSLLSSAVLISKESFFGGLVSGAGNVLDLLVIALLFG